jgi:hypothetical protein
MAGLRLILAVYTGYILFYFPYSSSIFIYLLKCSKNYRIRKVIKTYQADGTLKPNQKAENTLSSLEIEPGTFGMQAR